MSKEQKIISPDNKNEEIKIIQYTVPTFDGTKPSAQKIMDSLFEKTGAISLKQDLKTEQNFKMDDKIKSSMPDPAKEMQIFEMRVQEETAKRIKYIEKKAYEDGFEKAKDEGYNAGLEDIRTNVEPFVDEIVVMLMKFRKIRDELIAKNEEVIIKLLLMMVEKIIMSEYNADIEILRKMIAGAIKMTNENENIEIKLNKEDFSRIQNIIPKLADELGIKNGIRVDIDAHIEKGGLKVISNLGVINATLEEQLKNLFTTFLARIPKTGTNLIENQIAQDNKKTSTVNINSNAIGEVKSEDVANLLKEKIDKQ